MVTINNAVGLFSKIIELRTIKNTPAVTSVAAWIRADTGVGPSIASGNQICKPICADLPKAPQKRSSAITVSRSNSKDKKLKEVFTAQGVKAKTVA